MRKSVLRVLVQLGSSTFLSLMLGFTAACVRNTQPSTQSSNPAPSATQARPTETVPPKLQTALQDRDSSLYDYGGRLGCKTPFIRESRHCEVSLQRARNFVWKHWQVKTRGYIIVSRASPDAASNAHIFVEPDDRGEWQIVWRWESIFGPPGSKTSPGTIFQVTETRSIRRKRASESDIDLRLGTSFLVFLDKAGERVEWL